MNILSGSSYIVSILLEKLVYSSGALGELARDLR
jgi:hypothetical protein